MASAPAQRRRGLTQRGVTRYSLLAAVAAAAALPTTHAWQQLRDLLRILNKQIPDTLLLACLVRSFVCVCRRENPFRAQRRFVSDVSSSMDGQ